MVLALASLLSVWSAPAQEPPKILQLLQITPQAQSVDYVNNQTQFQLHTLLTEQRHPKTWNLSFRIQADTAAGLEMLLSVDEDISRKMEEIAQKSQEVERAAAGVTKAILEGRRIYVYGCGATGRLAKQMESSFWRPFWRKLKTSPLWAKVREHVSENIENHLTGEMTGADRALISSLEGFEDLQLIGRLQLQDHGIRKGDMVFCVTEGGETSSVIGTVLAALQQYGELTPEAVQEAREHLYFIYNNPDEVLLPFHRSRTVIENPAITKIRLFTGPQSITGSTRMQATTSETFVMGVILEHAIHQVLKRFLSTAELSQLGFSEDHTIAQRLLSFIPIQRKMFEQRAAIAKVTALEAATYANRHFSTYFAGDALITVFIDSTERSPTFRLYPLDTSAEPRRKCWIQVWTVAKDGQEAWQNFLGRPFYGLDPAIYEKPFATEIQDTYLREAALRSLKKAGHDQQNLYDFAFAPANVQNRAPQEGDLGVMALMGSEIEELANANSPFHKWLKLCEERKAAVVVILVGEVSGELVKSISERLQAAGSNNVLLLLPVSASNDPLGLRRHMALKMVLNAHSTAVMAKLGRVIGNTMTNVNPGNLKLIGRATFLILSHVNDVLAQPEWIEAYGRIPALTYAEANAVLFDTIEFQRRTERAGETAEVAISIIRILEAFKRKTAVTNEEAFTILQSQGLANYLLSANPSMRK